MTTSRRDSILSAINQEGQSDFRGIMRAIKAEATETGGAKSKNDLVEEYKNDCSEELRTRMEGVMKRDAMGPHEGTAAPTSFSSAWARMSASIFPASRVIARLR